MSDLAARLEGALQVLVGDGPIKQRLAQAWADHLEDLDAGDVPSVLRPAFDELRAALQRVPPVGKETRIKASVQKMSFAEAARHATEVARLCIQAGQLGERAEPLKIVPAATARTPRYLSGTNS